MATVWQIGDLARRTGIPTPTLRFYEEQGLLTPTQRTESGYRLYGPEATGRLAFIQRAKALGLTLAEIRLLVQVPDDESADLTRVRHAVAHKLADTRRRIAELETLQRELENLHRHLAHGAPVACGRVSDCSCWLTPPKETLTMAQTTEPATDGCSCCGCTCPAEDDCSCCGCPTDQPCC